MKKLFWLSTVCIFAMLLFVAFTYAAWPPNCDIVAGYAQLSDSTPYVFRSDGGGYYTDVHLNPGFPGDKLELAFNKTTSTLDGVLLYLGKPDRSSHPNPSTIVGGDPPYPPGYCSPRKTNFLFDIKDGITTPYYKKYGSAFDILVWNDGSKKVRRGNSVSGKYYLNNNSVNLGIRQWVDSGGSFVHDMIFTIEPSTIPCSVSGPNAVTETAINNFYKNDKNYNYEDYKGIETSIFDLVVYYISFNNAFTFDKTGSNTWTISGGGGATLGVVTVVTDSPHLTSWIPLATYANLPFQVTVSTTYPFTAPPRFDKPTTLWGEIKSR